MKWPFARKKTVNDLTRAELDTERIRLEEEERRVLARLQKTEDDKKRLFRQGADETSQRQRIVVARKIKEIDEQSRELNVRASMISKKLRVVNRLSSIQRNKRQLKEKGLWKIIGGMSAEELDVMLTEQVVRDSEEQQKVQALLDVIAADPRLSQSLDEDEDVLRLAEKMEQASESGMLDETFSEVKDILHEKATDAE